MGRLGKIVRTSKRLQGTFVLFPVATLTRRKSADWRGIDREKFDGRRLKGQRVEGKSVEGKKVEVKSVSEERVESDVRGGVQEVNGFVPNYGNYVNCQIKKKGGRGQVEKWTSGQVDKCDVLVLMSKCCQQPR